ncbi:23S rRNA pseudouridine(1911/1915/1917) synthase RluD [Motiliproteus sp. SC1-56]|uniref:23S rRNA pseudouridine(1911/1915/1917) synthase RluD n=1 Tax=Motiliproteus sp. SC1-56 TaxID=2799565 RepID=UPI001A8D81A4|nr:23S rRNA pseudouridine(1911/1915/1917) synthase RluD [Motiliproteus sp. SC1-56]
MSQEIKLSIPVPTELGGYRLDQAVAQMFPEYSRSRLQSWIKSGELQVNGETRRPRDKLLGGEEVRIHAELESQERWEPEAIALDIVYEDEAILVLNKPAGLVVHPAAGHSGGTLLNALLHHAPEVGTVPRAGIVHRLDKDTTGLMVVAKTLEAQTDLVAQLQERAMGREYEAVVCGVMTGGGSVDEPMGRHPKQRQKMAVHPMGKDALTHYRLLHKYRAHTHVRLKLETGRTHQIRVHMAHIHYPLVGDPLYGGRFRLPKGISPELRDALRGFKRQALHARQLTLWHPVKDHEMSWEVPLPEDMQDLLQALAEDAKTLERY